MAENVRAVINRIIKEKDRKILTGTEAMRRILVTLQKEVTDELGRAALGSWDSYRLKQMLVTVEDQVAAFEAKSKAEAAGLLADAWRMGQMLVDDPLLASGMGGVWTGYHLSTTVLDTLKDFTFGKISGVADAAYDRIKAELTLGILGSKTPQEVAKAIGTNLRDPSVFRSIALRAETITRLEMGRVFSEAAQTRMAQAATHVPDLEKMWRHAGHPKQARPTHLAAYGQHVPWNEPFMIGGVPMMFPRDPAAPLEETINCGCDHVPYHPDWG